MERYIVYVKTDEYNRIEAVISSAFLTNADGWIEIDSGIGDKYHHAQNNYFDKPIYDERGLMRYRIELGVAQERTAEDMDADWVEPDPKPDPTERIAALEEKLAAYEAAYMEGVKEA